MKLLLTSSGITTPTIEGALADLLTKPIAESRALIVATGIYPFDVGPEMAAKLVRGEVDFSLIVHYLNDNHGDVTETNAETWASKIPAPTYVIDEKTALKVVDGAVEVVSDGAWKLY